MPRINFEDKIYADFRFKRLIKALDNEDLAVGVLVRFWRIAQAYWGDGKKLVPDEIFEAEELLPILEAGLAEKRPEGIYAVGAEKHFEWYLKRKEGGRKRAKTGVRDELGHFKSNRDNVPSQPGEASSAGESIQLNSSLAPAPLQLSTSSTPAKHQPPSPSPSPSLNTLNTIQADAPVQESAFPDSLGNNLPIPKKSKFSETTRVKMASFFKTYAEAYKAKYGGPPEGIRDKAIIGKVGHWIAHVSEERANALIEVFIQIDYRPFNDSHHDLWQFFRNLNRIGNALHSGKDASVIDWGKVFGGGGR